MFIVRIGIHAGHYSWHLEHFLSNLVTLAILGERWILRDIMSSTREVVSDT